VYSGPRSPDFAKTDQVVGQDGSVKVFEKSEIIRVFINENINSKLFRLYLGGYIYQGQ
jgi:hypothetical protein